MLDPGAVLTDRARRAALLRDYLVPVLILLIAGVPEIWLASVSIGAVSCGAITYIGNGPNFMVKSVAESRGVAMPSFGGYIGWTIRYLVPTLIAMVCLFIAESLPAKVIGLLITAVLLGRAVLVWLRYRHAARQVTNLIGSRARDEQAGPAVPLTRGHGHGSATG